jgi:hypothetical protein
MKTCPFCHLLNNDEDTKCGNCGMALSSGESPLSKEGGDDIQSGVLIYFLLPILGLADVGLLIAAIVRGTFKWAMLLLLLLQAIGIAESFFPDFMYKLTYGFLTKEGEQANPGDYYYGQAGCKGYALIICSIFVLAIITFIQN